VHGVTASFSSCCAAVHQGCSLVLRAWFLCYFFGWLLLCVVTALWLLGAADVTFSFLSLQHFFPLFAALRGSHKPCQQPFNLPEPFKPL
jgi:hypothetical protein